MKLSIHRDIKGKPDRGPIRNGRPIMLVDGQEVNPGYGWITDDIEWAAVFDLITVDGHATSAALTSDHRTDSNFDSRQLFMVDIDSGMTIPELFENEFYNNYGAGFYTTPSHSDDAPRFRIMFVTETPIVDSDLARYLFVALMRQYANADPVCKDSTRIFYGTRDCVIRECRGNQLPDAVVAELVANELDRQEQKSAERAAVEDDREFAPASREEVELLLDELRKYYTDLPYADRRTVTWAVVSAVGKHTAVELMRARWSDRDKTMSYEGFVNDHKTSSIHLGSIVHMIRQHNKNFRIKQKLCSPDDNTELIEDLKKLQAELNRRKMK